MATFASLLMLVATSLVTGSSVGTASAAVATSVRPASAIAPSQCHTLQAVNSCCEAMVIGCCSPAAPCCQAASTDCVGTGQDTNAILATDEEERVKEWGDSPSLTLTDLSLRANRDLVIHRESVLATRPPIYLICCAFRL